MNRLLTKLRLFALTGAIAAAQLNAAAPQAQSVGSPQSSAGEPYDAEILHQIRLEEAAAQSGEKSQADRGQLIEIYMHLGNLYAAAGMYPKAEGAMRRAITLMKSGPPDELALALGQLGVLHVKMGDFGKAARDEMQALRNREAAGDPIGIALTWNDIAGLYIEEQKFKKAVEYGQKAFAVLGNRADVSLNDSIFARQTLGYALAATHNCGQALPLLKDALQLSIRAYGEEDRQVGYPEYALGFGYWQCGEWDQAAEWLYRGTTLMKADFGWDRSTYLNAMQHYSRFLRESGQLKAAVDVEAQINQANAVVDARTLSGTIQGFRSAGTR